VSAITFLQENIDESAKIAAVDTKSTLSPIMNSRYAYWELSLLDNKYLLANPRDTFTAKQLSRDFARVESETNLSAILYVDALTPYMKRSLIAAKVPFLLSDKQVYLPFITLNITGAKFAAAYKRDSFTPSAQQIFLYLLYAEITPVTQQDIQEALGLPAITVSRAIGELKALDLVGVAIGGKTNRQQEIEIEDRKSFYKRGMAYFGKAIRQSIYCTGDLDRQLVLCGLSALSKRTMLTPPKHKSYALPSRKLKSLNMVQVTKEEYLDTDVAIKVDLLTYDPSGLALDGMADPVTMILTLQERDERVDKELANYMERYVWYTD